MIKNKIYFLFDFLTFPRNLKNLIVLTLDLIICFITLCLSFYFRQGDLPQFSRALLISFIVSITFAIPTFNFFGFYKTIFRYFDLSSIKQIFKASIIYLFFYSIVFTFSGVSNIPRTIGLIHPILLFIFVSLKFLNLFF